MKRFALAVLVVLALSGCAQAQPSSVDKFTGAEAEVAQKVEDLEKAGKTNKPDDICSDILAKALVDQLKAGGTDCSTEMKKAIEDADDFDLEVLDVNITGTTATARVRRGGDGPTETMQFTRENKQWRATALSSSR
jgi:PBP1b-binding outer membrane lipoprotein LpoB